MKLLAFGLGYSARAAIAGLSAESVVGTTRTGERAATLAGLADMILFDGETASDRVFAAAAEADHLLVSIAPRESAAGDGAAADRVLAACGAALAGGHLRSVVYLSTVGVYGDHGGETVTEESACRPTSVRNRARLVAEAEWRAFAARTGIPVAILRLAGIYGPGRNAFVALTAGRAHRIVKPGQVFNRIHVDDIAAAIALAFARRADGLFNIADDEPAPPQDVVAFAAGLMGIAPPPEEDFATAELTPMARSFYGENKRVSNARSRGVLGLDYRWPTYRDALTAMWTEKRWR